MKILKLKFKNINSLKGEHEIDFTSTPLSNSGIFAIVGPTGSGKSTILDVITLSLFNKTPRIGSLTKSAIEAYGAIITKNTDDAFAEIEYEAQSKSFRSKWTIKKARTGTMRDYEMELFSLSDNQFIDAKRSEIPDRNAENIGLTYDQFLKSIVLSQGEFARFIKESANERANLLEKITGTEIYREIGKAAFERHKLEKLKYEQLENSLNLIKELSDDVREELKNQIESILIDLDKNKSIENELGSKLNTKIEKNKLISEEQVNQYNLLELNKNKQAQQSNFDKLEVHEQLIPVQSEIEKWQNIKSSIKECESILALKNSQLELLNENQIKQIQNVDLFEIQKKDIELSITKFEPLIEQALLLDQTIQQNQRQILDFEQTLKLATNKESKIQSEIDLIKTNVIKNQKELSSAKNWKIEHEILAEAVLDENLIQVQYASYLKKMQINNFLNKDEQLNCKPKFIEKLNLIHEDLKKKTENLEVEIITLSKGSEFSSIDLFALNEKNNLFIERINLITRLLEYSNSNLAFIRKNAEIEIFINDLNNQKTILLKEIIDDLEKSKEISLCKTEVTILLERQRIEAKYEEDRSRLIKGESCFLCGSIEHPYKLEYKNCLTEAEIELEKCNKLLEKYNVNINTNRIDVTRYEAKVEEHKNNLELNNIEIEKIKVIFSNLNDQNDFNFSENDPIKLQNYLNAISEDKNELEICIRKIEQISIKKQKYEAHKNEMDKVKEALEETEKLFSYLNKYGSILTKTDAYTYDLFIKDLKKNIGFYSRAIEKINLIERDLEIQNNALMQYNQNLLDAISETSLKQIEAQAFYSQHQSILILRKELGIESPIDLRSKLQFEFKKNADKFSELGSKLNQNKGEITILTQSVNDYKMQLNRYEAAESNINFKILNHIQSLGYNSISICISLILGVEDVNKIQKQREAIQKQEHVLTENLKSLKAKIQVINQIDQSFESIVELEKILADVKIKQNEQNRLIGELIGKQQEDDKKKEFSQTLKNQLEIQAKCLLKWNNLKELIGDASGQKFSKIAQDLSLTILIELANRHLVKFSDRYYILKKDEDDLMVVDTYLADTERSVKTLSGGETFLISLALSLGLSELASNNISLGCLFIDEGFGTLDANSLDIALDALEKLQVESQRVVGIISHVQALKDRITTQIELVSLPGGYSKIEIH